MPEATEVERRERAIELQRAGWKFSAICRAVGRSHTWLGKWLGRYRADGPAGLHARSRRPQRVRQPTPPRLVARILAVRDALVARRRRRHAFAGRGPEAIHWELEQSGAHPVPALRTIARVLQRHGRTAAPLPRVRGVPAAYPRPRARGVGAVQQTDLVGPRHVRGPRGLTRFFAFHTLDLGSRAAAGSYRRDKSAEAFCAHFLTAWELLGVPGISQTDNELSVVGGNPHGFTFPQPVRLGLLLGTHWLFIPPGEPGRNADVESFNGLWQDRVLRRHACPDLAAVRRKSAQFFAYYLHRKPHPALRVATHGSRFPGAVLAAAPRRALPPGFTLAAYRDGRDRLALPLARGRLSFIRRVAEDGTIELPGGTFAVGRRRAGQYVVATLFTHRQELVLKLQARVIKRVPCPIREPVVPPLRPLPRGRC